MNENEFYLKLDEMLELASGTLRGGEVLAETDGWDSVAVITFIALADSEYGVLMPPTEIAACRVVSDLADLVARYAAAAA